MINNRELEYIQFKRLLEYFVSHLEWIVNGRQDARGYDQFIKPLIENGSFKRTGQGYADDAIQEQIQKWENYSNGKICINIQPNYGSYFSSKCYLNWESTGLNVLAKWDGDKIDSLYQEEYFYWEKPTRRIRFGAEKSIISLGLFDGQEQINPDLINFYETFDNAIIRYNELERGKKMRKELEPLENLLLYKKQIILQGPPGTGKTRLAKIIGQQLVGFENKTVDKPKAISDADIKSIIKAGKQISSSAGSAEYHIADVLGDRIKSVKSNGTQDETLFKNIRSAFSSKLWDTKIDDNPTRRVAAFAKYIYDNINSSETKLEGSDQFKLVQFHPSYTYEDFVRGIVAKPNPTGNGVLYVAENKALGEFAKRALDNYLDSKKPLEIISQEVWVRERIKDFQKYLEGKLGNDEKIWLTQNTAYITRVTNETIRYKGDNWKIDGGVPYSDLEKMYLAGVASLTEIRELQTLTLSAKSNTTYWQKVLELFKNYIQANSLSLPKDNISDKIRIKNYVLIIDEINRANLSSVLGELIYALEYRGEGLDGMYAVDDTGDEDANKKLILPPNLYIIGTMNTADRSVGHIDYAIRRRFAFVDVLPENLQSDKEIEFHSDLFKEVAGLFVSNLDEYLKDKTVPLVRAKYLSSEFEAKDVWLGHSYFIQKKVKDAIGNEVLEPLEMATRLQYEIVPILNEYVKDGILNNNTETLDKIKEIANYPIP